MTSLLPMPAEVSYDAQSVPGSSVGTALEWVGPVCPRVAKRLEALPPLNLVTIAIERVLSEPPTLGVDESYCLEKGPQGWRLTAPTTYGALAALTTLAQLNRYEELNEVSRVEDRPRFPWRGVLIDVARHAISIDALKQVVDGMAEMKLNVLHLHLSDDQAFRFESRAYPALTSESCLTQSELKSLVAHGSDLGVRIVPEIDIPGHVNSWLVAMPELGYQQVQSTDRFGVHKACLDPSNEKTYQVIEAIFHELADVFPDEFVHIGGDEVHPAWWGEDPAVQEHMQRHGLSDTRAVQNHFTRRIVDMLAKLGKKAIGWDEVLHPDMPKLVVQNWRGATTRDRAAEQGLATIVSAPYYLDLFYPLDVHYAYDPEAPQDDWLKLEDAHQHDIRLAHVAEGIEWTKQWRDEAIRLEGEAGVLGGEACLWSELVDEAVLPTRLWSRLPAVAEKLWSEHPCDIHDLYRRVEQLLTSESFNMVEKQAEDLFSLGLSAEQVQVAMWLEPVKWYGRLLGQEALDARIAGQEMPQARPYQVHTPLNRIVDFIAPESLSARKLGGDVSWAQFIEIVLDQDAGHWPADASSAIQGLQAFARLLQEGALTTQRARDMYLPHGEYMLAPIYSWLVQRDGV